MRLIDADKLEKEIIWPRMPSSVFQLNAVNLGTISSQDDVKAIPIEWIKEKLEKEEYRTFLVDYIEWGNCLRWLLEKWEKENEQNKENTS